MNLSTCSLLENNTTPAEYFDLRARVYKDEHDVDIPQHPDTFDKIGHLFGIFSDSQLVGGARLTINGEQGIPLEHHGVSLSDYFNEDALKSAFYGEISRLFIRTEFRSWRLLEKLYSPIYTVMQKSGFSFFVSIGPIKQLRITAMLCTRFGWEKFMTRNIKFDPKYSHVGEFCLVKATLPAIDA